MKNDENASVFERFPGLTASLVDVGTLQIAAGLNGGGRQGSLRGHRAGQALFEGFHCGQAVHQPQFDLPKLLESIFIPQKGHKAMGKQAKSMKLRPKIIKIHLKTI